MFKKITDRAKIYSESVKADMANRMETSNINTRRENLNRQLREAYADLGEETYKQLGEEIPFELQEKFMAVTSILEELAECDIQEEESARQLDDKKKEIDQFRQEMEEKERQERELKEMERAQQRELKEQQLQQRELLEQQRAAAAVAPVCPYCGASLDEGSRFCNECGQKVE